MTGRGVLTKILAIVGVVLVWFPLLAPFVFSVIRFIQTRRFLFDYLIPAELFPVVLVGGGLLLWAALRAHSNRGIIGWGLGLAVLLLVAGQVLAVVTGLASGETEPVGVWWALVLASIVGYFLASLLVGIGGLSLLRGLFITSHTPSSKASL